MGWQPAPSDARHDFLQYEYCILSLQSGMVGGPEINLVNRIKTDQSWSSVGASDGNVYMSGATYEQDVATAGGFAQWWTPILVEINRRLLLSCAQLSAAPALQLATPPATGPASFADFPAWLKASAVWSGGSVPTDPGTTPGQFLGDYWGKRSFELGFATETGLRFHADGRIERIERIMKPNVGWEILPRA